jgi:hypothetical protein
MIVNQFQKAIYLSDHELYEKIQEFLTFFEKEFAGLENLSLQKVLSEE